MQQVNHNTRYLKILKYRYNFLNTFLYRLLEGSNPCHIDGDVNLAPLECRFPYLHPPHAGDVGTPALCEPAPLPTIP